MNVMPGRPRTGWVTGGVYGVTFVLGVFEALIGSFQYARSAPLGAIGFCLGIGVTCLLAGWAMRSATAAFIPAIGWIVAAFVLSMPMSNGSVIITNTSAGKWFLYGGTVSVALAVAFTFGAWLRLQPRNQAKSRERPASDR